MAHNHGCAGHLFQAWKSDGGHRGKRVRHVVKWFVLAAKLPAHQLCAQLSCVQFHHTASMLRKVSNLTARYVADKPKGCQVAGPTSCTAAKFLLREQGQEVLRRLRRLGKIPARNPPDWWIPRCKLQAKTIADTYDFLTCAQCIHNSADGNSLLAMLQDTKTTPGVSVWSCLLIAVWSDAVSQLAIIRYTVCAHAL